MDNAQYYAMQNIPKYSIEGNLRDRGYPSSYDYNPIKIETHASLPSNGGNGGGGKTSTGTSTAQATTGEGYDMAAYLAELNAQRQAAAQAAYDKSMGLLNDAYDSAAGNYAEIFNRGRETLKGAYDNSRGKIDQQATDAMQQAYTNYMLSKKNLAQQLAAMGISGGASESTAAGLQNNYMNSRNNIQKTWDTNLSDLEQGFNTNLTDLANNYQTQMAELSSARAAQAAQLLSNLNNQIASASGDYYSLLSNPNVLKLAASNALTNLNKIQPTEAVATNDYVPVNTQQVNDMGGKLTNWAKEQLENTAGNGAYDMIKLLSARQYTPEEIANMLIGNYK